MKFLITLGVLVGSTLGSFIPLLWGAGLLSYSSIFFSGVGGVLGLILAIRIGNNL